MTRTRVIVAGLGAMGTATADELAGRGVEVLALEALGAGHANGSSHGPTRIVRRIIEEAPFYVPIVLEAFHRWAALEADCGERLIVPSGVIRIAPPESDLHRMFRATATEWDLPFEELSSAEVMERFPGFAVPHGYTGLFEAGGAGFVLAARALGALRARAERRGATLRYDEPVRSWSADASGVVVTTAAGRYEADALVLATGAWTARLVADLGLPLEANRVVNASFAPPEPAVFDPARFPAFIVADDRPGLGGTPALRGDGIYGIPFVAGEGVKVGAGGTPVDPDHVDRTIADAEVDVLREWVERFLPAAVGPVVSTLTCLYVKTPDEHFVVGRHPGHDNVVVASPCSGHGFKYTPAMGAILADLALGLAPAHDLTPFAPTRFGSPAAAPPPAGPAAP